jgi:16S rRNA C967 or C1407 C5-methylase (RsmB/RsmF family)
VDVRLLDPSCSGSGIVNRLDYLLEDGKARDITGFMTLC